MSYFLQVTLGLSPAFIALLVYMLVKKRFVLKSILATSTIAVVMTASVISHFALTDTSGNTGKAENTINLAYALATTGDIDKAYGVLSQYTSNNNYADDVALCMARVSALGSNYVTAKGMYEKYIASVADNVASSVTEEYNAVLALVSTQKIDSALVSADESYYERLVNANFATNIATSSSAAIDSNINDANSETSSKGNTDAGSNEDSNNDLNTDSNDVSSNETDTKSDDSKSETGTASNNESITAPGVELPTITHEDLVNLINDHIEDELDDNSDNIDYNLAATYVSTVEEAYTKYINSSYVDDEQIKKCNTLLSKIEEQEPDFDDELLLTIDEVRLARLQNHIMNEDYRKIAADVNDNSCYQELIVVGELYQNNYVDDNDFDEDFLNEYVDTFDTLQDHLQDLSDSLESTDAEYKDAISYLKYIKNYVKKPGAGAIIDSIQTDLETNKSSDISKAQMELVKLKNSIGNSGDTVVDLGNALSTAVNCSDGNYKTPASQIQNIIEGNSVSEIKSVVDYAEQIADNIVPVKLPEVVKSPAPSDYTGYYDNDNSDNDFYDNNDDNDGNDNDNPFVNDTVEDDEEEILSFPDAVSNAVSQINVALNIMSVDASNFKTIKSTLSIDTNYTELAELKSHMKVNDCYLDIPNFQLEKKSYDKINILLCCDTSGSMDGAPIENVKNAVSMFINEKSEIEQISLVTFSSSVETNLSFGTSTGNLLSTINNIYANGGTAIYDAALTSLSNFEKDDNTLNVMILMSDGEDNYPVSMNEIYSSIGKKCQDKNVVIYSMGIGSGVDTGYLGYFSDCSGGSYIHVSNSASAKSFYEYLHSQLNNQYELTYTVEDTLTETNRILEVTLDDELLYSDTFEYSIGTESEEPVYEDTSLVIDGLTVYGIDTKILYKGDTDSTIKLLGNGFDKVNSFLVSLESPEGNIYSITAKIIDSTTVELIIPKSIPCAIYDLRIVADGKLMVLPEELYLVTAQSIVKTSFGPYVFTSFSRADKEDNTILLSGAVTLNNWLVFYGDVILSGDLKNSSITLLDEKGAMINYDSSSSTGYAKYLAEKGINISLPAFGSIVLYNDTVHDYTKDEYTVDKKALTQLTCPYLISVATPGIKLYPNRFVFDATEFKLNYPGMSDIIKAATKSFFSYEYDFKMIFTGKNIGIDFSYKMNNDDDYSEKGSMLNAYINALPVQFATTDFEITINTIESEYFVKYCAFLKAFDFKKLGFSIKWKDSLIPDEVKLYADKDFTFNVSGVPLTVSDFMVGVSGLSDIANNLTLVGSMDVSAYKISALLPGLEKWIGDLSILKLDDAELTLGITKPYIAAKTELKLLEKITLAAAEMEIGEIKYSNVLLNMSEADSAGFRFKTTAGIKFESDYLDLQSTGSIEFNAHTSFIGLHVNGTNKVSAKLWVFTKDFEQDSDLIFGFYPDSSGSPIFIIKAQTYTSNKNTRLIALTWSHRTGLDLETKNLI